jgi:hypothetical protein
MAGDGSGIFDLEQAGENDAGQWQGCDEGNGGEKSLMTGS